MLLQGDSARAKRLQTCLFQFVSNVFHHSAFNISDFSLQYLPFHVIKMGKTSVFKDSWVAKYPFIKEGANKTIAFCKKCNCEISISNGGITAIDRHVQTDKHKRNCTAAVLTPKLTDHFRKKVMGKSENELVAAEGLFAYHTVKHNQIFRY